MRCYRFVDGLTVTRNHEDSSQLFYEILQNLVVASLPSLIVLFLGLYLPIHDTTRYTGFVPILAVKCIMLAELSR